MDRTSSMGLWTYSHNFMVAASELVRQNNANTDGPAYYLVSHAIELSLKAFLRGSGLNLEELKKKLGHDLSKCLSLAVSLDLDKYIEVSDTEKWAIAKINDYYSEKELEYISIGYKEYPPISILISFNEKLLAAIRQFCFDKRGLHA